MWDSLAAFLNLTSSILSILPSGNISLTSFLEFSVVDVKLSNLPVLEAEAELRGFLPLHSYVKTLPQSSVVSPLQPKELNYLELMNLLYFRMRKTREFALFACSSVSTVSFSVLAL